MNFLKFIWTSLGDGYTKVQRNPSYTKKGPGRRHDYVTQAEKSARAKAAVEARAMLPA